MRSVHQAGGDEYLDRSVFTPEEGGIQLRTRNIRVGMVDGVVESAIYQRESLPSGFSFDGPAVIEQNDTTTLVEPGWHVLVDAIGNLILSVKQNHSSEG